MNTIHVISVRLLKQSGMCACTPEKAHACAYNVCTAVYWTPMHSCSRSYPRAVDCCKRPKIMLYEHVVSSTVCQIGGGGCACLL
jgi:hypothetical protein